MEGSFIGASLLVKRADLGVSGAESQMDIDHSGIEGFMPHKVFYGQEIHTVFIKMSTKGVPEGMAGDPVGPAEFILMVMDMPGDKEGINGPFRVILFRKEPAGWLSAGKPVLCEDG